MKWINKNESNVFAYNDKYFYRGVYDTPSGYDLKLESPEIKKVSQYDRLLKKYHYKEYEDS